MTVPRITLASLDGMTQYAPLLALGWVYKTIDLWSPIQSRLVYPARLHSDHPQDTLLAVLVSILAGCRSVHQINTSIRPDRLLAQAWGQACFDEQSTVARVLDNSQGTQVEQLRQGSEVIYRWTGQAPQHDWRVPLIVDIDLTALPTSARGQGSTKGYLGEKRGALVVNYAELEPPTTRRVSVRSSIPAIP